MLCFGRTLLSFDPFPRTTVETAEEAPILRGKEVEGKLLIGFTESSCVLSLKYHLSAVQSTVRGRQHLKTIPTVNTAERINRGVGHLLESSDFLCFF